MRAEREAWQTELAGLRGKLLRVTKAERDLRHDGDLFLNEAEQLAPTSATQEDRSEIEVAARTNGNEEVARPFDPSLPRER